MFARLLGTETFKEIHSFPIDGRGDYVVGCASFSADGGRVIAGPNPRSVRAWNTRSGGGLCRFEGNGNLVLQVALSSDGAQTLSLGEDEEENIVARLWYVGSGRGMGPFHVEEQTVYVAFSPDGRRVLTGGWEGSLLLREA